MANAYSLDQLRADVERDFQPVVITLADGTEVSLRNLLRLPKKDRDTVMKSIRALEDINEAQSDADDEDVADLVDTASDILALVADSNGKKLIKELDGDITLTMRVLEKWMASTSPGEATPSAS